MGWLYLALRYIIYHPLKSLVLMACVFLTAFLPIAIELLLGEFESGIVDRANSTPLVVGPSGSRFDLTLKSLYFRLGNAEDGAIKTIPFGEASQIDATSWAKAVPLYAKFSASGYPVVGTTLDYMKFRNLKIASGDNLIQIGDCVLGGALAESLDLGSGDKLLTDIQSVIALAAYPMKMHVRGVLKKNNSPDDWAVFVDLKTAWIVDGIGHGHQNLENEDEDKLLSKTDEKIVASAAVLSYTEITPKNIDSFHFHGDTSDFPVTSIIAIPKDKKGETILMGRYRNEDSNQQLVVPGNVIQELMDLVFKVKRFFDANAILIAISTILLLLLIVVLSIKLREREMNTMFKIGASKNTVTLLQLGELGIIFSGSIALVAVAFVLLRQFSGTIIQSLLIGV